MNQKEEEEEEEKKRGNEFSPFTIEWKYRIHFPRQKRFFHLLKRPLSSLLHYVSQAQRIQLSSVCSVKTIFQRWARSIKVPLSTEQNRARVKPLDSVIRGVRSRASKQVLRVPLFFLLEFQTFQFDWLGSIFRREFWNLVILFPRIYVSSFLLSRDEYRNYVNNNNISKSEYLILRPFCILFNNRTIEVRWIWM